MGWTRWNHKHCAQQGEEKHIHHPADTERYKLYQGHAEHGDVCSGLNHVHHRPIFWVGCSWKSVQGIPSGTIPVCEHHTTAAPGSFAGWGTGDKDKEGNSACHWVNVISKRTELGLAPRSDPCSSFSFEAFKMAQFWSCFSVFVSTDFPH